MSVDQAPRIAIAVSEIEAMLKDRAESLVSELLPNAVKVGHEMCVGSLHGERGQSLRINIGSGAKRGWWKDFSGSDAGDMLKLVSSVLFGGDIKRAIQWSKSWLGLDDADPGRIQQHRLEARARSEERARTAAAEKEKAAERARSRWHQAQPIGGTIVETYLAGRAIDLRRLGRAPGALRFHPALQYGYQGPKPPAMVAMCTNLAGQHIATHRTWLAADGSGKAGADVLGYAANGKANDPRKVMGNYWGGHIPVWKGAHRHPLREIPAGTDVYVSEGIEDALTAACADPGLRIIAAISVGNMMAIGLPPQMGRLIILKQNDPPGSDAERGLARAIAHHRAAGRRVAWVEVPKGVKDLNDLARGALQGEVV